MSNKLLAGRGADAAIASSIRNVMEKQRQMSLPVAMMRIAAANSHPNLAGLLQVNSCCPYL